MNSTFAATALPSSAMPISGMELTRSIPPALAAVDRAPSDTHPCAGGIRNVLRTLRDVLDGRGRAVAVGLFSLVVENVLRVFRLSRVRRFMLARE